MDTFNPYKAIQFNWNLDRLPPSELIGAADFPSLWNQAPREGLQLHWDGNNDSVDERNLSAGAGGGITPVTVDHAGLTRVRDWTWTLKPPAYPYPVDKTLAARGAAVYAQACSSCHGDHRFRDGVSGRATGWARSRTSTGSAPTATASTPTPPAFAANQYALFPDSPLPLQPVSQDPRLRQSSARRHLAARALPAQRLGADTARAARRAGAAAGRRSIAATTSSISRAWASCRPSRRPTAAASSATTRRMPGNGNGGHVYGTTLPDADKRAIVEYMKTF